MASLRLSDYLNPNAVLISFLGHRPHLGHFCLLKKKFLTLLILFVILRRKQFKITFPPPNLEPYALVDIKSE
jgi:hypothetical protein